MTYTFTDEEMERLRAAMHLAPSILNQRPWYLRRVADDRVEVYSVPDENLGILLPREVVISCGAALYNLRLAIQVAGREPSVHLLPKLGIPLPRPSRPGLPQPGLDPRLLTTVASQQTLLASVEVMPGRVTPPTVAEQELYEALWLRHTDRRPFRYLPIPPQILMEMETAAARERGWLRVLPPRERRRVLRAVAAANRRIRAVPGMQNMLFNANKVPPSLNKVPNTDYGPTPKGRQAEKAPPTRPTFWLEDEFDRFEKRRRTPPIVRRRTQLMGLSTDDDRPLDWLRAGEALQHALLNGTRFSMSAQGGRSAPYRQPLYYAPLDPHQLWRRPPTPGGYAVEASFLTQSLELADLIAIQQAGYPALELADLEAVDPLDPGNKQRRENSKLRWPWRTYITEIPQVVLRVGYTPVRSVYPPVRGVSAPVAGVHTPGGGQHGTGSGELYTDGSHTVPVPHPLGEPYTVQFPPTAYDDQDPVPHPPAEEDEL